MGCLSRNDELGIGRHRLHGEFQDVLVIQSAADGAVDDGDGDGLHHRRRDPRSSGFRSLLGFSGWAEASSLQSTAFPQTLVALRRPRRSEPAPLRPGMDRSRIDAEEGRDMKLDRWLWTVAFGASVALAGCNHLDGFSGLFGAPRITVPAGTEMEVQLAQTISSES